MYYYAPVWLFIRRQIRSDNPTGHLLHFRSGQIADPECKAQA
jgi:hypothetical protein